MGIALTLEIGLVVFFVKTTVFNIYVCLLSCYAYNCKTMYAYVKMTPVNMYYIDLPQTSPALIQWGRKLSQSCNVVCIISRLVVEIQFSVLANQFVSLIEFGSRLRCGTNFSMSCSIFTIWTLSTFFRSIVCLSYDFVSLSDQRLKTNHGCVYMHKVGWITSSKPLKSILFV